MKILVTAFGPFDGRPENASSLALRGLMEIFPQLRTRILPVDSVVAPARLKQALKTIRPDALVMLGEAAGSRRRGRLSPPRRRVLRPRCRLS